MNFFGRPALATLGTSQSVTHDRSPIIEGIFAIITLVKFTLDSFLSPNLTACSFGVYSNVLIPLSLLTVEFNSSTFNFRAVVFS
jgi:hypothetical protein